MEYQFKTCSACGKRKPIERFGSSKRDGVNAQCKVCRRQYYYDDKEDIAVKNRERYERNKDERLLKQKAYSKKNKDIIRLKNHFAYLDTKEVVLEERREYFKEYRNKVGKDVLRERQVKSIAKKPEHYRELQRKHDALKRHDPKFRMSSSISRGIRRSIKNKNNRKWERLTGYTLELLCSHLEKRFKDGMSWDNYGEWHIDHKIPLAAFNFKTSDDIDFKKAWALSNLQPLWRIDNQKKSDSIEKPFQPAFSFCGFLNS